MSNRRRRKGIPTMSSADRDRRTYRRVLAAGLMISVAVHALFFELAPSFRLQPMDGIGSSEMVSLELPPEVEVPPPPAAVARPAMPRVSDAPDLSEDVTIAPTTFEANPVDRLPPPPTPSVESDAAERPRFIPYDTPPRLLNTREVERLLMRTYPPTLREAAVGGVVLLWIYVDAGGRVERSLVKESSGYAELDRAAERVAESMRFSPALNRDAATAVWVQQRVVFEVH